MDPARTYSYEYLCFRITDYRPDPSPQFVVSGEEARHDVRLFVEDVSDAANLRVGELPEPVHTVEDLSRMFNVSTKTISRWRELGLVSRRFVFAGGKKRVGFLQSSVERFVSSHVDRVQRGERFSQLTPQERSQIIQRARRLARAGAGQAEVARRIAKRLNRSVEAIRYTLKLFDQKYPALALFPDRSGPLTDESKEGIYQDYRRGQSVGELAERFGRTAHVDLPNHQRNAGPAAARIAVWIIFTTKSSIGRTRNRKSSARCPPAATRRRSNAFRRVCPRTWVRCTKCRC